MPNFDAIIIGTGQSGPALARRLVAAGRKVAIIERKLFGGTCVNTGCNPTKTLIASAYAAHVARWCRRLRHQDRGAGQCRHEGGEDAKGRCCRRLPEWRRAITEDLKDALFTKATAALSRKKVAVNGSELAADQIFINVGARAAIPPTPGLDQVPYLTNSSMMDIDSSLHIW